MTMKLSQEGSGYAARTQGATTVVIGLFVIGGSVGALRARAGKKPKPDNQTVTCDYLRNIINYPSANPYIKAWAISLHNSQGYGPTLP
jgi:hypothetical protein